MEADRRQNRRLARFTSAAGQCGIAGIALGNHGTSHAALAYLHIS